MISYTEHLWRAAVPLHSRTHGAVIHVTGGTGKITVGESTYDVGPGHVVIFLPTEEHAYAPAAGTTLEAAVVTFTPDDDPVTSATLGRLRAMRHFSPIPEAQPIMELIRRSIIPDLEFRRQAAEHMLAALLCSIVARVAPDPVAERVKPIDAAMEHLFRRVDARLADVAGELGVTPEAIRKQFRRHFGDSPMHYFSAYHTRRLGVALMESDATLRELAEEFGFYDEFHLSRVFKRHTGVSPNQYRKSGKSQSG